LVEFWKLWSQKSGYDVEFKFYNWDATIEATKKGEVIFHSGISKDRDWMVNSTKFYEIKTLFYRLKGSIDPKKPRIGLIDSSYETQIKEHFPNAEIIKYDDYGPLLRGLIEQGIDLFYDDEIAVDIFLLKQGAKLKIEKLSNKSSISDIYAITNEANTHYIKIFNDGLAKIKKEEFAQIELDILGHKEGYYGSFLKADNPLNLNQEEINWLKSHPKIIAAGEKDWAPVGFVEHGNYQGISNEYLNLIKKNTGLEIEIKTGMEWGEILNALKNKSIDLSPAIYHGKEREPFVNFSMPYYTLSEYIFAKKGKPSYSDLPALYGKKIAVIKDYQIQAWLSQNHPQIKIVTFPDLYSSLRAVEKGLADAFISDLASTSYAMDKNFIRSIEVHSKLTERKSLNIHMGVRKDWQILADIISKVFKNIKQSTRRNIKNEWIALGNNQTDKVFLNLTEQEQNWLKNNPHVKVGGEMDWAPFDFVKGGEYQGISKEILDLIAQKVGLNLSYVTGQTWKELLADFESGKLDILPAMYHTEERDKYTLFSPPYFKIKDYIFTRSNDETITSIADLENKKVAVIDGYAVADKLKQKFPNIDLVKVKSISDGIDTVLIKKADVYIDAYPTMMYILTSTMQSGLKPVIPIDFYANDLHIGTNHSKPLLASIISKGLQSLTLEEKSNILLKWMAVEQTKTSISLSEEEQAWIDKHPIIKVANEMDWPPFDYNEFDSPKGLSIDIISLIASKLGLNIEYINGYTWTELLELFKQNKIDVMPAMYRNNEREKFIRFTSPYYKGKLAIFSREKDSSIKSYNDLSNKKIGMQLSDGAIPIVKQQLPNIEIIELEKNNNLVQALATKKLDAIIGNPLLYTHFAKENQITNIHLIDYLAMDREQQAKLSLHMGVQKENVMLHGLVQKTMNHISHEEMQTIQKKWTLKKQNRITLSLEEKTWIQNNPVITYSEINWKPLSIIENGSMKGILGDYLNFLQKETGIEFKFITSSSWPNVLEKFKKGEIDIVPSIGEVKEQQDLGLVSESYVQYPMTIVTNENINYVKSLDVVRDKVFSLPKYYTSYKYLKAFYPNVKIIETKTIEEALQNVADKKADIYLGHLAPALYYIEKTGRRNLKISGNADFEFKHHLLISQKHPELLSIANKIFDTITQKERDNIYHDWVHTEVKQSFDYTLLWKVGAGIVLLFLIFAYYNRRINLQKQFVQTLLDSQEQIIITTDGQLIRSVNRAFLKFYAVSSVENFIESYHAKCICNTFNTKAHEGYLQIMMGNKKWIDYVIHNSLATTHKAMISKGNTDHIFSVTAANLPGNKGLKSAVFTNITEVENAKLEVEELHKHTRDSIEYASLIQGALIPDNKVFYKYFKDFFAIWRPKDIVGGDIYLAEELSEDEWILMVIDCTGHGVPGAFVTMLVKAVERQLIANLNQSNIISPAKMLSVFNRNIKHLLQQESVDSISNAGFDGGILYYNKKQKIVRFAGAETPLFIVQNNEMKIIKGNRHSIGYKKSEADYEFTDHNIDVSQPTQLYLTTDGYLDQNGGDKGFPFGKKRFTKLIQENANESFADQQELLLYELQQYQKDCERNDDITVVGIKI